MKYMTSQMDALFEPEEDESEASHSSESNAHNEGIQEDEDNYITLLKKISFTIESELKSNISNFVGEFLFSLPHRKSLQ